MKIQTIPILIGLTALIFVTNCQADAQPPEPNSITAALKNETTESETIKLIFPSYPDGGEAYYYDLLQKSLNAAGYDVIIERTSPLPQQRAVSMLENGQLSIIHLLKSQERDQKYTAIDVNLTRGLIGNRILLIPANTQDDYANISSLEDFKTLHKIGAFGKGWFDVNIWQANDLPYTEVDGEWRNIYDMLEREDRGLDYFSRGFTEIIADAEAHPNLAIESHLLFIYDRDFLFYLSPAYAQHEAMIEDALQQAQTSGLMDELIQQYWQDDFTSLDYENRTKILLTTPE